MFLSGLKGFVHESFATVATRSSKAGRIDFVTHTYPDVSIKNSKVDRRASQGTIKTTISGGGQKCPNSGRSLF